MKLNVKGWKREGQTVTVKDKTHTGIINHIGQSVPTFKNMERRLIKELRACR